MSKGLTWDRHDQLGAQGLRHAPAIHLYRARLFGVRSAERGARNDKEKYPWESPQADLAEARRLIYKHGYLRRKEELEDAEQALLR